MRQLKWHLNTGCVPVRELTVHEVVYLVYLARRIVMTTLQAMAFGAMLVWTPSLVILAAALWDVPEVE